MPGSHQSNSITNPGNLTLRACRPELVNKTSAHSKTVLVICEDVTLAHVARTTELLDHLLQLTKPQIDLHFAVGENFQVRPLDSRIVRHHIKTIPSAQFLKCLWTGNSFFL